MEKIEFKIKYHIETKDISLMVIENKNEKHPIYLLISLDEGKNWTIISENNAISDYNKYIELLSHNELTLYELQQNRQMIFSTLLSHVDDNISKIIHDDIIQQTKELYKTI